MKSRKMLFSIYLMIVSVLLIGWYPKSSEKEEETMCEVVADIRVQSEKLGSLAENNQLCRQEISESREEERMAVALQGEQERRKVKKVIRYRIELDNKSRKILERIVEAEAGDQTIKGRQMVANVIMNRVLSSQFPNTVKEVVFAHRQFSPISNGRYYRVSVSSLTKQAVEKALREKDNTRGALYFMYRAASDAGNVSWFDRDLIRLYKYGCHEFFK